MQHSFVKMLLIDLMKEKLNDANENDALDMIEDTLRCLNEDELDEFDTNQRFIRMRNLFRGFAVKVWKGINFNYAKYHALNKV